MSGTQPGVPEDLIVLIDRITRFEFESEAQHNAAILELQSLVADPMISDYIYYWDRHFDSEPSAADIAQRALAYQPIELGGSAEVDGS